MEGIVRKRGGTYEDVLDAPSYKVAEIVHGELRLSPRPGGPATFVASALDRRLAPFEDGGDGPGGWLIAFEPELHVNDQIVVPDLAAWRIERMPMAPEGAFFTVVPDWVCEVLSRSTEQHDREDKMALYASWGVSFAWLIQPMRRIVESYRLDDGAWTTLAIHTVPFPWTAMPCRVPPFDAIEIDLARLWAHVPPPRRASEPGAYEYDGP